MTTKTSTQQATLDRFIAGWRNWSAAEMVEPWSDECTLGTMPFSMGHPPRNRSQVLQTLPMLQKIVTNYQLTIHEIVHDEAKGKAVVYAISKADAPFGEWNNEYAVFFTFDETREKIAKIEEMVDSSFMKDFFPKFQAYMQAQQPAQ